MRTRKYIPFLVLLIVTLTGVALANQSASARLQMGGTPQASPVGNASPVATAEPPAGAGIVTMVLWYQQNSTGDVLQLSPVEQDGFISTRALPRTDDEGGRVVFEEPRNEGYPRIRIGKDDYFDAAPIYPGDPTSVQRWYYYNDDPALRPATMVMQITGIRGQYDGWTGTATFISRGTDQGGILIIAISPPA